MQAVIVKRKKWLAVLMFIGIVVGGVVMFFHAPVAFLPGIVLAQKLPFVKSLLT